MKVEDILSGGHRRRRNRGSRITRVQGLSLKPIDLKEGGHGFEDVGAIHISEIKPTLARLERDIGVDLQNNVLGSVGKKEWSGDIDVAITLKPEELDDFIKRVNGSAIVNDTKKSVLVVMSSVQIQGYDEGKVPNGRPRTGNVQVDYMIDEDPAWLKTFYHSPSDKESNYKGAHRNIALGALSRFVDPIASKEKTEDGRPLEEERYMFSSKLGLVRIIRRPVPKKNGQGYTKQVKNEVVGGPWKTADEIASKLKLGKAADINSFETIFAAVEENLGPEITRKFAQAIADDKAIQDLGIPEEVTQYLGSGK